MRQPVAEQVAEIASLEALSRQRALCAQESDRLALLLTRQKARDRKKGPPLTIPQEIKRLHSLRAKARSQQWRATEKLAEINIELDRLREAAGHQPRARGGAEKRMDEMIRLTRRRAERGLSVEESERMGALMAILRRKPSAEVRVRIARLRAELEIFEDIEIGRAGRVDYDAPILELVKSDDGWIAAREVAA